MDIKNFLEKLQHLLEITEAQTVRLENNAKEGRETMTELLQKLEQLLPEWFLFIEKTEIGMTADIFALLEDIQKGIIAADSVYLADVFWNGLRILLMEYIEIIEEALDGE